ncbi:uncharacterized protein LOC141714453 [Apium graveolens]|uniref:uncharacterized protein LOC141714453 n=1 Tax=Apium graveolens TaxID=4045 RepID=UPI003D7B8915
MAAIYQSVPEDILLTLAEKKTTKEAWEAVKMLCQGVGRVKQARIQTLKAEFESMNMKDTNSLDDFCLKLNGLVTNIRALGESVDDAYVIKKLLRVVPGKFLQIASIIEQFGNVETMTVEEIVGSLKAHEECLRGQNESGGQQLLLTEEEWNKREKEDRKFLLTREEWLKSAYGHFAVECKNPRKDREMKEGTLIAQVPDEEPALLMMKYNDGKEEKGKGSITLQCNNGESSVLKNVYYIPALRSNIISLGQLAEEGHKVVLSRDSLWERKLVLSEQTEVEILVRKKFINYCEEAGIKYQFTAPYSPHQNGVIERRNRTMIEMAHSLLKEKELPLYIWGEAIRHTIYLLNRLTTRAVMGVTPYET